MASPSGPGGLEDVPEAIVDEESKGFPVVWLLPLVALLVGGWLFYKTMSEKGPEVVIRFQTAEGVEAGKTLVKFRDVTVGKVDDVEIADDLKTVLLTATMDAGTDKYLTDASRFWVVKPRVGAGGVTGLGTLFSGAYIAFEPDKSGEKLREFTGLEQPPIVPIDKEGTKYKLRADTLGSLSIGAPVYFRQFDVGEVTDYKLSENYDYVDIGIFVQAPYDSFVRNGSHFWNAGGVRMSMDASGITLEMESVVSLLSGGIAFDTLPNFVKGPLAEEGAMFTLYESRARSLERPITEVVSYVLRFSGTVRGLSVGAPVEYRGIRVGTVKEIMFGEDPDYAGVVSPVVIIDIEPERTMGYREAGDRTVAREGREQYEEQPRRRIDELVEKGLRARLQTGSLVTGQLFVEFDIFPDAEPATVITGGLYPEIPTVPNAIEGIIASVNTILDRVKDADLQGTLENINELMVSSSGLMSSLEQNAPELAAELQATLQAARTALATLEASASPDGAIGNELQSALAEISAAARSIRVMAEYLERHPEAMLKGKGGNP